MNYGLSYVGSKGLIAEKLVDFLPKGNRLVDLFGGGCAITHCACSKNKYKSYLYNELNLLVVNCIRKAIRGDFPDTFEFLDKETFDKRKDHDPISAFCFSFSADLENYIYPPDMIYWANAMHNIRVFNDNTLFFSIGINTNGTFSDINNNFDEYIYKYTKYMESLGIRVRDNRSKHAYCEYVPLNRFNRIKSLESLKNKDITITQGSYINYKYQEGDVVYCDIPYENTRNAYGSVFDYEQFYNWVASRPYQVFFSSYDISDNRFYKVFETNKSSRIAKTDRNGKRPETVYSNMPMKKFAFGC